MIRRRLVAAVAVGLVVGFTVTSTPALAAGPVIQVAGDWKLLDGGVISYHPELNSVVRTPPDLPLIRFDMEAYVFTVPKTWRAIVELEQWVPAKGLHPGTWEKTGKDQRWGINELPAAGKHAYLMPPMTWECQPGEYVVYVQLTGISGSGSHDLDSVYFPWANWKKGGHNVYARPKVKDAFHTECQGGDRIHG